MPKEDGTTKYLVSQYCKDPTQNNCHGCLCLQMELYSLCEVAEVLTNLNPIY